MLGRGRFRVESYSVSSRLNLSNGVTDFRLFPPFQQACYFYYITLAGFSTISLLANRHFDNGDTQERFTEYYFPVQRYVRIVRRVSNRNYCLTPDVDYFLIPMLDRFTQLLAPTCLVTR